MSGGTKKKYKQYEIHNIEEACQVLGVLISGVICNLEKYKEYSVEVEQLLCNSSEDVPAKKYEDLNDKLLYRQHEMLKYIADHQGSSFSYIDIRDFYVKRGYLKEKLSNLAQKILNEFLDLRNWTFHNPQSLMVAEKEVTEKSILPEFKQYIKVVPQINPVIIQKPVSYDLPYLESLLMHTKKRIVNYEYILNCMKKDYQDLFDSMDKKPIVIGNGFLFSEVQYIVRPINVKLNDNQSNVAQISMAIQKSKYDGSDEAYNKFAIFRENREKM